MRNPWEMYNRLIEGVPAGIAVREVYMAQHWLYVDAECGMGISHVVPGGALVRDGRNPVTLELRELASWVKSWSFLDASIGIAALNAWYSQPDKLASAFTGSGEGDNPFDSMRERYAGKKVVVVGHFPNVDAMVDVANLTVLERECNSPLDTPDPACEFIMPDQDYAFITGITITNKTAPRLLELSEKPEVVFTGPSAVPALFMFEYNVDVIAGSFVLDPEPARAAIQGGSHNLWREGIKKFTWRG